LVLFFRKEHTSFNSGGPAHGYWKNPLHTYICGVTKFRSGDFVMRTLRPVLLFTSTLAVAACATAPTPVVGLPGPNKDIATFRKEDSACRQEAGQAARTAPAQPGQAATAASGNTNEQWKQFFASYTQCETAHGNVVQPVPWAVAYADYLGTNTAPYAYAGYPYPYAYGYPYAYAGYPGFYGDPFLFGYPYPFFFGVGYGFGYGRFGYAHFGGFHGGFHSGHR